MKFLSIQKSLKIFTSIKFALFILLLIALASSFGSFLEQDQDVSFYQKNYQVNQPIFGFITWKFILQLGLDHVYRTWWFFCLLISLVISLISCTITRQFPIFSNSKDYFLKKNKNSFIILPFCIRFQNIFYLKESILRKIQESNFYVYQKHNFLYAYKGLIGRVSPVIVHFSLICILLGSALSAFNNFQAQEFLPKGEIFHIQNPIQIGWFTTLPTITVRINDFWVEYESQSQRIHQFYSNISVLNESGNELFDQTISVNNPLHYKNIDFYQSDWNLLGIRFQKIKNLSIYESPLFEVENLSKSWITWITNENKNLTILFDQFQNIFFLYDKMGNFVSMQNINDLIDKSFSIIEVLPSTGLQIKYDPNIVIIYIGFGLLMITTCLSYLPYTQFWVFDEGNLSWLGGSTNRGKIQFEIQFENFVRTIEKVLSQTLFVKK